MPRVAIKKKEYKMNDFQKWLVCELKMKGLSQSDLAEWYGISQPAVSQKIRNNNFTLKELLILFEKLQTPQEQIGKLLKVC